MNNTKHTRTNKKNRKQQAVSSLRRDLNARPDKVTLFQRNLNVAPALVSTVLFNSVYSDAGTSTTTFAEYKPNTLLGSSYPSTYGWLPTALTNRMRDYAKYRVIGYRYKVDIVSRSASDYMIWIIDSPAATGITTSTVVGANTALTLRHARMHIVPANTKSPCVLHLPWKKVRMIDLIGSDEYLKDDNYVGTTTAAGVASDPTDFVYLTFINSLATPGAQTANNSPLFFISLELEVEFFDPRN